MKNLSLVLNIVLLVAVIFLFVKVYSDKPVAPVVVSGADKAKAAIVYVNSDSILDNFPLLKKLEKEFEHKRDSIDKILASRDKSLKDEYAAFEQRAATLTQEQGQKEYEGFMRKQEQLVAYRDELLKKLSDEQEQMQDSVHNNLIQHLKEYNKSKGYQYILSYQRGSGILLADDSLNITPEIMKSMMEEKK